MPTGNSGEPSRRFSAGWLGFDLASLLRPVLIAFAAAYLLWGCAGSVRWSQKHPAYTQAPYGELAVAIPRNAFVLTRIQWFANRLGIASDSIQLQVTSLCEKFTLDELRGGYGKLNILPADALSSLPEESQKIDERIFLKGKFPEQGVALKDSSGNVPPSILLIHEVIIGTDLNRENYFDYSLIHNESQTKKAVTNITAIVSYTLWDNYKQRPLFNAIDEIQQPVKNLSMGDMDSLMKSMVRQIRSNLYLGAK